ncbi:hypothetical protein [Streptomyces sp. NBC_00286]|uniref:hypothetical protein n=1 Tax=Streptomyces sp. NBC_00286 TaxID=2975701 RepID=UPI002E2982FA|nr:hypothetical protein [Streptomyces sp. NBC_00286]
MTSKLDLARRHLGRVPVSQPLPKTDAEAASIRDEVVAAFEAVQQRTYYSLQELIEKHRDPADDLSLADLAFVHMPGGHAPMVDFHDNPWMGELLHTLRDSRVPVSLICHAPIALTSARYRVGDEGTVTTDERHAFKGANITTVPRYGERMMLETGVSQGARRGHPPDLLRRRGAQERRIRRRPHPEHLRRQGCLGRRARPAHRQRAPVRRRSGRTPRRDPARRTRRRRRTTVPKD